MAPLNMNIIPWSRFPNLPPLNLYYVEFAYNELSYYEHPSLRTRHLVPTTSSMHYKNISSVNFFVHKSNFKEQSPFIIRV